MKRLQFRHHEDIFASRAEAMQYFADIADASKIASTEFGDSLYSEPMVAKYKDESGTPQVILAIGADSGKTMYHIIDTGKINLDLSTNASAISAEVERAMKAEESLSGMQLKMNFENLYLLIRLKSKQWFHLLRIYGMSINSQMLME